LPGAAAPVPGCARRGCQAAGGTEPDGPAGAAGLKASLERLQLEYVDVVFANRPDPNTPMEGGCRAAGPRSSLPPSVAIAVGLRQVFISRAFSLPEQKPLLHCHGQPLPRLSPCHPQPGAGTPLGSWWARVGAMAGGLCPVPVSCSLRSAGSSRLCAL